MKFVKLENEHIEIVLIPDLGAKMVSLIHKRTGTNFLLQSENNDVDIPEFGAPFDIQSAYGFDECFPTVERCKYNVGNNNVKLPDHGEVWSRKWSCMREDDALLLSIHGVNIDYYFEKKIRLVESGIVITYTLRNLSEIPFYYIWSAHPLLKVQQNDRIILPEEVQELLVNWSSDASLGIYGDRISWPLLQREHETIDLSAVQSQNENLAVKLFSDKLRQGKAALYKEKTDESLYFRFNTDSIPYLGIWLCYGGWPENREKGSYTIALEPATGRPDALSSAIQHNEASYIEGDQEHCWNHTVQCVQGKVSI